jgi:prepilin-type N-terminal cleavage/methylation domain-containing protein
MRSKNGFTLIELLITITVMAILLTLTVVSLRSSQAVARDEERKTDVAAIAQALENYYNGDIDSESSVESAVNDKLSYSFYDRATYPPTAYFTNEDSISKALITLDMSAIRAPGVANTAAPSLRGATSTGNQSPTTSTYIYQPLKEDGTLCSVGATPNGPADVCREFTLYYQLETVSGVQTITSQRR